MPLSQRRRMTDIPTAGSTPEEKSWANFAAIIASVTQATVDEELNPITGAKRSSSMASVIRRVIGRLETAFNTQTLGGMRFEKHALARALANVQGGQDTGDANEVIAQFIIHPGDPDKTKAMLLVVQQQLQLMGVQTSGPELQRIFDMTADQLRPIGQLAIAQAPDSLRRQVIAAINAGSTAIRPHGLPGGCREGGLWDGWRRAIFGRRGGGSCPMVLTILWSIITIATFIACAVLLSEANQANHHWLDGRANATEALTDAAAMAIRAYIEQNVQPPINGTAYVPTVDQIEHDPEWDRNITGFVNAHMPRQFRGSRPHGRAELGWLIAGIVLGIVFFLGYHLIAAICGWRRMGGVLLDSERQPILEGGSQAGSPSAADQFGAGSGGGGSGDDDGAFD